jgi:hypothetical protein
MLIDEEWADILREFEWTSASASTVRRKSTTSIGFDFKGRGTHAETVRGIELLRAAEIDPGLIVVCNPGTDPERVVSYVCARRARHPDSRGQLARP